MCGWQNVKGVVLFGNFLYYFVSSNLNVKMIVDLSVKDCIVVLVVGVLVQLCVLQYVVVKQWGDKQFDKFDVFMQVILYFDVMVVIFVNSNVIIGYFGNLLFQEQEFVGNLNVYIVLNFYDVLGGLSFVMVLYVIEKFCDDNLKIYCVFVVVLVDVVWQIVVDLECVVDIYICVNGLKIDCVLLLKILCNLQVQFKIVLQNMLLFVQFMYCIGVICNELKLWCDYFFDDFVMVGGS